MGFKVLVVGAGAQGKVISADMAGTPNVDEIRLCDISLEACKHHKDWLKSDKVSVHKVDASEVDDIASLAKGVDIVVNAVIPQFNLNIMEAALRSGAHYIDLAWPSSYEEAKKEYTKEKAFLEADLTAVIGHGATPGGANILAANATDKLSEVESIRIRDGNTPQIAPISTWSPHTFADDCHLDPLILENGKLKKIPPFSGEEIYVFPEPVGPQRVWFHDHEEPAMFERSMKGKGLKNCDFKMNGLENMKVLYEQGFLSNKHINVNGTGIPAWELTASLLPAIPTSEELRKMLENGTYVNSYEVVIVEVTGIKDGEKVSIISWETSPSTKEIVKHFPFATEVSYLTGMNGSLLARMMGRGDVKTRGVITPELVESEVRHRYVEELALLKPPIRVHERIEKPLN